MESMRQSCRPKHQVLILKCFPVYQKGVQEVKPNASELSYLLYYVSTRRSKLTKVCSFLEKRAARDVWRRKLGNVQVTLEILTALMEKVPRDLPIYARYVLSVIDIVLRSQDISMVEDSIATFETFCQHQDMASLAAEMELSTQYQGVVRMYASFADTKCSSQSKPASSSPMSIRWRNAGLRAIRGVVGSDETLASDGGVSLKLVLPVILDNLYTGEEDVLVLLQLKSQESEKTQAELAPRRRVSVATVQTVDAAEGDPALASQSTADADRKAEMDVRLLALRCLEQIIISGSTRGQIRVTTITILRFILGKAPISSQEKATGDTWATSLMELVAKWCPVQVRFVILNAAMEVLLETNPTEENLDRSSIMVYMVDWLLKSSVNMIGLSVMDVLLGLMQYLSPVLSPGSENAANGESTEKHLNETPLSERRRELLDLLVQSVGHLATHIYYGDQITDIIRTVLSLLKPGANHEHSMTILMADQPDKPATPPSENAVAFSSVTAKVAALKAVKNILVVASGKKPAASAGVESRNRVGIHVWEDTQWLLRDQREVYYTYSDALLCWLRLETNETDLRVSEPIGKPANPLPKQLPEIAERSGKRNGSASGNHRAKAVQVAQSNFLRLLHLTIYEHALERSGEESEILLLHLLLTNLVEHLGVNAVRFGLPMILKLQSDANAVGNPHSAAAKVNIGGLIFGYLWELTEKFNLDVYAVGSMINSEIDKRRNFGVWLDNIRLPPVDLDAIASIADKSVSPGGLESPELLNPFGDDVQELVDRIEEAYNGSIPTPVQSPPSSPERGAGNGTAPAIPQKEHLPSSVKDEMLAGWSKETCLAAVQKERARTSSISGSKAGTLFMRNRFHANGARDSSFSTASPVSALDGSGSIGPGGTAGLPDRRRLSVPEFAGTPMNSSSRGSAVRVNELRRVLSNNHDGNARRLSPLRGRLDASNSSIMSSSSESMVSGYSASEFEGDGASSRPQSVIEGETAPPGDGVETPRASGFVLTDGQSKAGGIPPVPSIPPSLSIPSIPSIPSLPGGFPSESSQASTPLGDRPVTAPAPRKQAPVNGSAGTYHAYRPSNANTLNRNKSRSSTGLASAANGDGGYAEHDHDNSQRQLNDFLSSRGAERPKGTRTPGGISGRRTAHGGIGRPPY